MTNMRVYRNQRVIQFNFSAVAADAMLTELTTGRSMIDISDIDWKRITLEANVTSITGTNVIFKMVTSNDQNNSGATTDAAVVAGDGSTAFVSATITATGRYQKSITSGKGTTTASNVGKFIGVWADVSSATISGSVFIYLDGTSN